MFKLLNKKLFKPSLGSRAPFFQIRSRSSLQKKNQKFGSFEFEETNSVLQTTKIPLPHETLEKKLGLVLKMKGDQKVSQKLSRLESQLQEISMESVLQKEMRNEEEKKTLGKNIMRHSLKESSKKVASLVSNHQNKKKLLEEQLEPVEFKVNNIEDFKDSPTEILQKKYQQIHEKTIEKSQKTVMEYIHGENGVDNLKPPPEFVDEFQKQVDYLKDGFERIASDMLGMNHSRTEFDKIKWLSQKENMEKLKDLENTKIVEYPGSSKGANPEDDPEHFLDWYKKNAPAALLELNEQYEEMRREEEGLSKTDQSCELMTLGNENLASSEISFMEAAAQDPMESFTQNKHHLLMKSLTPVDEIEQYPEQEMMEWNENIQHVERWLIFRMFPKLIQLNQMLDENFKKQEQWIEIAGSKVLPSLYRYYNLLPKFAREAEFVKDIVRGLEFAKPQMTLKEKELSLNFICQYTLPMDALTKAVCLEACETHKYFITEDDDEKFINDPEPKLGDEDEEGQEGKKKTEEELEREQEEERAKKSSKDIATQLAEAEKEKLKQKKLELQEQIKRDLKDPNADLSNKYGMWQRPPCFHQNYLVQEEPDLDIPLEFYDNDDGFWDEHIKEKERKYNLYPMIYHRPYFKH